MIFKMGRASLIIDIIRKRHRIVPDSAFKWKESVKESIIVLTILSLNMANMSGKFHAYSYTIVYLLGVRFLSAASAAIK